MYILSTLMIVAQSKSALASPSADGWPGLAMEYVWEGLNFLDFFVSFLCQDKNESLSGRT